MGACARPLSPAEIAVGGGGAAFAWRHHVAVDADAHGAAGFPPLEAGVAEDAVEPFSSAWPLTGDEPGDTNPGTLLTPPARTAAASRRSPMRALVQEPMKMRSTAMVV